MDSGIPWLSDDANATRFPLTRKESGMSWQVIRSKESPTDRHIQCKEPVIEFTRWEVAVVQEFAAVELTFDEGRQPSDN
jgi:hypothetical protein